ncbi:hypothetical protein RF11_12955 [Thelohanellus kitauei]|uniref:Uncharacterized protein n=1 Tax=Thelohanellus kitauei TaxID=669202 RepID=A0A0C2MLX5_THEKT|nr:hypothetical protein RF11_12955 [Thelohanellus kitauei]
MSYLSPYLPFLDTIKELFPKWKGYAKSRMPENESEFVNFMNEGQGTIIHENCDGYCIFENLCAKVSEKSNYRKLNNFPEEVYKPAPVHYCTNFTSTDIATFFVCDRATPRVSTLLQAE